VAEEKENERKKRSGDFLAGVDGWENAPDWVEMQKSKNIQVIIGIRGQE